MWPRPKTSQFGEHRAAFLASIDGVDLYCIERLDGKGIYIGRVNNHSTDNGYSNVEYYLTGAGANRLSLRAREFLKAYVQLMR